MESFERFEDIQAWKSARELMRELYEVTDGEGFAADTPLRDRLRREAATAMARIAAGFERCRRTEFIQFLAVAKGSLGELRSYLYVALDRGYITQEELDRLLAMATETGKVVLDLMRMLRMEFQVGWPEGKDRRRALPSQ